MKLCGPSCVVLVPSCDKYSDLWPHFFEFFHLYWPDCPFPIYLGSDSLNYEDPKVNMLHHYAPESWGSHVLGLLDQLDTPYVLMILEDFFLRRTVNSQRILLALNHTIALDATMMRLVRRPAPFGQMGNDNSYRAFEVGCPYRVSTQAAFWNRERLRSMIHSQHSIWEFENSSSRSFSADPRFFGSTTNLLPYGHHVVEKGRWFPHEVLRLKLSGRKIDLQSRPQMPVSYYFPWLARKFFASALDIFTWQTQEKIRASIKSCLRKIAGGTS